MNTSEDERNRDFVMSAEKQPDADAWRGDEERRAPISTGAGGARPLSIASVAGFLILAVILLLVLYNLRGLARKSQLQAVENRLQQIEKRLDAIKTPAVPTASLEEMATRLQQLETKLALVNEQILKAVSGISPAAATKGAPPEKAAGKAAAKPPSPKVHRVRKGETLYRIAKRYGLSVEQLRRFNKLGPKAVIHPGQELKLGAAPAGR